MSDEARRLLAAIAEHGAWESSDHWTSAQCADEARAFLAQPTAAREAVYGGALRELVQAIGGRDFCTHCLRAHSNMGSHEEMHEPWCKVLAAFNALADTSPAAAALLAQGERQEREWDFLCSLLKTFAEGLDVERRRALLALPQRARAALASGEPA